MVFCAIRCWEVSTIVNFLLAVPGRDKHNGKKEVFLLFRLKFVIVAVAAVIVVLFIFIYAIII